jgi:dihydroxyacetone kinase
MTYLFNDPKAFTDEYTEGFLAAYPDRVAGVPGGVVRATAVPDGQVAVVIGGGSGHYPAFCGLVGPGLAHGAAMGNVFASPSAQQVYNVAKAANAGGGIFLSYGNYAGDVLNFDQAQDRLNAEGIPCKTVTVTDDITSAGPAETFKRRGVAGDLCVFKAACWAAEQGRSLDEVYEIAKKANARTRSLGIAFTGCTLPGADAPLFTVPKGRMAIGMGLHGEPGLREDDIGTAEEIGKLLVDSLLADLPEGVTEVAGNKVAVLTNGLGSVKYEELFVLHRTIDRLLREAGLTVVEPDVGEIATSFEMAGCSLTLLWLDDELEQAWLAPADTPAYRKGSMAPRALRDAAQIAAATAKQQANASAESQAAAQVVYRAIIAAADRIDASVDELGAMDAIAGDGDHGIGMQRGVQAAREAVTALAAQPVGVGTLLIEAADAWSDRAGGTSGAIWGIILRALGEAFGNEAAPDAAAVAAAVTAAKDQVMAFGKAQVGDKTLVDALVPFADALQAAVASGKGLRESWHEAAQVAATAARSTAELVARIGRSRAHGEKSLGTPDPGAVSLASIIDAVDEVLAAG